MKKVFLMIFTFLFFAQVCYAEGFELTVDSKTAKAGETVTIDLTFSSNPGIIAALFELEYDRTCLELVKAEDKGLLKGAVFSQTYDKFPYIMLWNSSSAENFTENGVLVTLTFKVLDNPSKDTADIKISYLPDNVYDADLNNIDLGITNGSIKITGMPQKAPSQSSSGGGSRPPVSVKEEEPKVFQEDTTPSFSDVKNSDWYFDAVSFVTRSNIMKGTSSSTFSPDLPLTRAMLVTVLYRNENAPDVYTEKAFEDVAEDTYYADAVNWAKNNNIVNGISETKFSPDTNITREQLVSILYRYARYKDYNVTAQTKLSKYDDFNDLSDYAVVPMQYAVAKGLIKGNSATTINPHSNATRAETATILHRFLTAE